MNPSIRSADAAAHFKIVATALVAAVLVVWIGIAARGPAGGSVATMPPVAPAIAAPFIFAAVETAPL